MESDWLSIWPIYNHAMNRISGLTADSGSRRLNERRLARARRSARYAAIVLGEVIQNFPWDGAPLRKVRIQDALDLLTDALRLVRKARKRGQHRRG